MYFDGVIFTYHFYDGEDDGRARLNARELTWDNQAWPDRSGFLRQRIVISDVNRPLALAIVTGNPKGGSLDNNCDRGRVSVQTITHSVANSG
jgi:hypothetical protein